MQVVPHSSSRDYCAGKAVQNTLLTRHCAGVFGSLLASAFRGPGAGRWHAVGSAGAVSTIVFGLAPTRGRSDAAGGANSGRSFDLSPRPGRRAGGLWLALSRLEHLFPLDPDPLTTQELGRPIAGSKRGRVPVPSGTAVELRWNHHPFEIAGYSCRFQRFQLCASRDARVCVRVQTRAYTRGQNHGTLEPIRFILTDHEVKGSSEVPNRFQLGTAGRAAGRVGRKSSNLNILAGGYSSGVVQAGRSTVIRGRLGETFGRRAAGGGSAGPITAGEAGQLVGREALGRCSTWCAQNGGNQPFRGARPGRVGKAMLEGGSEGRGKAPVLGRCRMPVRLRRTLPGEAPGGSRGPSAPPLAPIAPGSPPSMLAHERGRIWIGAASSDLGRMVACVDRRQTGGSCNGSGCGCADRITRAAKAGRGGSGGDLGEPGRRAQGRTEAACVN